MGTDNYAQGFIWAAFSIITILWSFLTVPETRGLSLEQIDYLYEQRVATRKFKNYQFAHDVLAEEKVDNKDGSGNITVEAVEVTKA